MSQDKTTAYDRDYFSLPNLCQGPAVFVLVLTAELLVLVQTLAVSNGEVFRWIYFSKLGFYVLWNVLLCAATLCVLRTRIQGLRPTVGATIAYVAVLLVSVAVAVLAQWSMTYMNNATWVANIDLRLLAIQLAIAAIMGGIALRYLYLQQQLQITQEAGLRSHIQALQSRIRPHFLFNSMNIVASLIAVDPDKAERVVEDLSELFRASLRAEDQLVPLSEELGLCRQYVSIEQLRLGERLQVEWHIDEKIDSTPIPSLALQPLLENAVYHGIQPLLKGGLVSVLVSRDKDRVSITVSNPVREENLSEPGSNGQGNQVALVNTRARLRAHFGETASLKTFLANGRFSAEMVYSLT